MKAADGIILKLQRLHCLWELE